MQLYRALVEFLKDISYTGGIRRVARWTGVRRRQVEETSSWMKNVTFEMSRGRTKGENNNMKNEGSVDKSRISVRERFISHFSVSPET